jgi:hypothetical protein
LGRGDLLDDFRRFQRRLKAPDADSAKPETATESQRSPGTPGKPDSGYKVCCLNPQQMRPISHYIAKSIEPLWVIFGFRESGRQICDPDFSARS